MPKKQQTPTTQALNAILGGNKATIQTPTLKRGRRNKTISLCLPPKVHEDLKLLAYIERTTISAMIEMLAVKHIASKKKVIEDFTQTDN